MKGVFCFMRPGEIVSDFSKYLENVKSNFDASQAKTRAAFSNGSAFLKKVKFEPDQRLAIIYPLEICLPFDPVTLDDDVFNIDNPLPLSGSPTSACIALRKQAKTNPEFAEVLARALDCSIEDLKVDSEEFDIKDIKLWHKFARIQYVSGYTQHLNTNPGQFKFGRNVGAKAIVDDSYQVIGTEGVGFRLHELETSLIAIRVQNVQREYEPGGSKADRPKEELKAEIKSLWTDRLIGNPYPVVFGQIAVFHVDTDNAVDKKEREDWKKNKKISNFFYYQKLSREKIINTLEKALSSKGNDVAMDFLEAVVTVPKNEDGDKTRVQYMGISYTAASTQSSVFGSIEGEPNNADLEGFIEAYRAYRDDDKKWSPKALEKSVFELRVPSDATLISEMSNSIKTYEDCMNSSELTESFGDILSRLDTSLTQKVAEKVLETGEDKAIPAEIVSSAPIATESNTDDNGNISELDIADILNNAIDDASGNN